MAIVTVQGASSGSAINVTVDGAATGSLGALVTSFSNELTSVIDTLNGEALSSGGTYDFTGNAAGLAVLAGTGTYTLSGNLEYIVFGDILGTTPTGAFHVDASGVSSGTLSVVGGTQFGIEFQAGASNGTFIAGAGNNLFTGDQSSGAGNWAVTTGDGNDTVIAGTGSNTINAGAGDNLILIYQGSNVVASYGQDTILGGNNSGQTVSVYGGSSVINVGADAYINDASSGGNSITVGGTSTIVAGTGDTISLAGAGSSVYAGVSDTISASGDATVYGAHNASIDASGSLAFLGTGATTITASSATIFGGAGLDVTLDTTGSKGSLFVANSGNETLNAANSEYGVQAFGNVAGYSGTQVFIGGTASDTLVAGVGDATMTGGSGAANEFAFRNGIAGASYEITDFGSAAGNFVFLYQYTEAELTTALANQVNSNGSTTITLSDGSTIKFDNVASLTSSQFAIGS